MYKSHIFFFFQAEDGIRDFCLSRGLGDVYKRQAIKDAIDVFIETIESRNLSKDEFDAMTLDDIKDYLDSIITSKIPSLHRIINELEDKFNNDSRNQTN